MGKIDVRIEWLGRFNVTRDDIVHRLGGGDFIAVTEIPFPIAKSGQVCKDCGHELCKCRSAVEKVELPICSICGGKQVYIRGRSPGHDNRLTCPACTQEKIDYLRELMNNDCGKTNL